MSVNNSDLEYKIDFQARINMGSTMADVIALQDELDGLERTGAITAETFKAIDTALENFEQRVQGVNVAVLKLDVSSLRVNARMKELRAEVAAAAKATREKEAADKSAAAQAEKDAKAEEKRAAALERTAKAAQVAAKQLAEAKDSQALRADTVASRYAFNTGRAMTQTAQTAEDTAALKYVAPTSAAAVALNEKLFAIRKEMAATEQSYKRAIDQTTGAFRAEFEQAALAGKIATPAEFASAQEKMRQEVVQTTDAYKVLIDEQKAAGVAAKEAAGFGPRSSSQSLAGSIGSFYPLILGQRFAQDMSKALLGLGGAAIKTSVDYQAAFADVSRTTTTQGANAAGQIEYIRQSLKDLDTQVPLTFASLSKIATMGNELGVSAAGILAFTKTAAEYSTVTGTSADQTANALGSLNEILDLQDKKYQNLGAAISYVGRMSVASEPEVVSMLQKIAANAHQAGMSSQEIIGLAATLASLKEPPERAQGALQIYFKVLSEGVAQGGAKLQGFATFLGMTAGKTAELAKSDPSKFLTLFLEKLNTLSATDKVNALDRLHLNATRVGEVLTRLAGHTELLTQLQNDANKSWAEGADLNDQFAKKTDTLAAKWTELQNAVSNLMADIGDSGLTGELKILVEGFTGVLTAIDKFVKTYPAIANFIVVFTGLTGAILGVRAAMIGVEIFGKAFGGFMGGAQIVGFGSSLKAMVGGLFGMKLAAEETAGAVAADMNVIGGSAIRAGAQVRGAGVVAASGGAGFAAAGTAAEVGGDGIIAGGRAAEVGGAMFAAGEAEATLGISLLITGIVALITWLVTDFPGAMRFAASAFGFWVKGVEMMEPAIGVALQALAVLANGILKATEPFAISAAFITNVLADLIGAIVYTVQWMIGIWSQGVGIVMGVLPSIAAAVQNAAALMLQIIPVVINTILPGAGVVIQGISSMASGFFTWLQGLIQGATSMIGGFVTWLGSVFPMVKGVVDAFNGAQSATGKAAIGGIDFGQINDALNGASSGFSDWANGLQNTGDVAAAVAPNLADYAGAVNNASTATAGMPDASGPLNKTGNAAKNAAKEVRTLVDYSNDLQSTFQRAFDIRTGSQSAADSISTQFQTMKKNVLDAKDAVQQARDKLNQLYADMSKAKADNVQQKYFLGVANQFGDSLRAADIQAKIQGNDATIATDQGQLPKATADLIDAENKATLSLSGNTAGAIANRAALNDLVGKYQDYIVKLAASGASQADIEKATAKAKAEFIKQATQLGFNKSAVDKVAKSFDDMKTIIDRIPRNVTVKASADPALQAINEFAAKAQAKINSAVSGMNNSLGGIGKGMKGTTIPLPTVKEPPGNARQTSIAALEAEIRGDIAYMDVVQSGYVKKQIADAVASLRWSLLNYGVGGFADGGYTGSGGKYQAAGVVHKGEYVVPAQYVNQSTGLPNADALGRIIAGTTINMGGYANGGYVSGDMMVTELGPRSLGVLRQMVNSEVVAVISAGNVTNAVNSTNAANRRRGR